MVYKLTKIPSLFISKHAKCRLFQNRWNDVFQIQNRKYPSWLACIVAEKSFCASCGQYYWLSQFPKRVSHIRPGCMKPTADTASHTLWRPPSQQKQVRNIQNWEMRSKCENLRSTFNDQIIRATKQSEAFPQQYVQMFCLTFKQLI